MPNGVPRPCTNGSSSWNDPVVEEIEHALPGAALAALGLLGGRGLVLSGHLRRPLLAHRRPCDDRFASLFRLSCGES